MMELDGDGCYLSSPRGRCRTGLAADMITQRNRKQDRWTWAKLNKRSDHAET